MPPMLTAAGSQQRTQLPIVIYVPRDAALLCTALVARAGATRSHGCLRALRGSVAGEHVAAQTLGVYRSGSADFQQFLVRIRNRAKAPAADGGMRSRRSCRMPVGQSP
jgi:hypothetical protein